METADLEQKAIEAIDMISAKLGIGVEHFWPLFVREQMIDGVFCLFLGPTLLATAIYGLYKITKSKKDDLIEMLIYFSLPIVFISAIALLYNAFSCLFNPEYNALKALMEMVK